MTMRSVLAAAAITLLAACSVVRREEAGDDDRVDPLAVTAVPADAGPSQPDAFAFPALPAPEAAPPVAPSCSPAPVVRETFASFTDNGTTVFVRLPEKPAGVIVALHGSGGSSRSLATESIEWASFFTAAAARDYAIVIPESLQREAPRQWDARSVDGDTPHIAAILARLQEQAGLPATLPIFIVGMSQGGGSAPIVGAGLAEDGHPVRAVGVYCAGASAVFQRSDYTLPTIFSLMENDTVMTQRAGVEGSAEALAERGVATDIAVLPGAPLCPEAFTRIPGIDAAASRAITRQLASAGVLDPEGNVVGYSRDEEVAPLIPDHAAFGQQVEEQLRVARAEHTFFGARNAATLDFFDRQRR